MCVIPFINIYGEREREINRKREERKEYRIGKM